MAVFQPMGATVTVAGSTTSAAATALIPTGGKMGVAGGHLEILNTTAAVAFLAFGAGSAPTATTAGYPVAAGARVVMAPPLDTTDVAVILSTGTGNVYLTVGREKSIDS